MSAVERVCSQLSRIYLYHHHHIIIIRRGRVTSRPCATRMLSMTSQLHAKTRKPPDDEETSKPIKFSTSKASHKKWNVEHSLGSSFQRPWWKVLPISIIGVGFLLWCVFRRETDIDESLEKQLHEHLQGLVSDEEDDDVGNKP